MRKCRRCGSRVRVARGLCEVCRTAPEVDNEAARPPARPDLEPPHDRPWVARSAFTRRIRRNPRS